MTRPSRLARQGAAAGTLVWALAQTAGRGRRGRDWASPRGNLYLSLVLRPACPPDRAAQLGFVAALGGRRCARRSRPESCRARRQMAERRAAGRPQDRRHPARIGDRRSSRTSPFWSSASASTSSRHRPTSSFRPPRSRHKAIPRLSRRRCSGPSPGISRIGRALGARRGSRRCARPGSPARPVAASRSGFASKAPPCTAGSPISTTHGALLLDTADGRRRIAAGDVFPAR